jgi:hypothetical protein
MVRMGQTVIDERTREIEVEAIKRFRAEHH